MIEVSNCVICDGNIRRRKRALVAPFLATRIWNREPFCVDLVECQKCGFLFYNPRLEEEEEKRLYSNYRSDEYLKMRHSSEPWYTENFRVKQHDESMFEVRRSKLIPILNEHIKQRKIDRILDFGGNRGDLIVGLFDGAEAFVYDISNVTPAPGVTAVKDPAACKADLIHCSAVLEHVGFPKKIVNEILQAAPKNGLIFIEVPTEFPFGVRRLARRIAQIGVWTLMRPALVKHIFRPATLYMMHEHINYYTESTLTMTLHSCGANILASGTYWNNNIAYCLASK
jgi:2-polyprenyl-3-methyl-5-hydroxy-6-metoxy-1,4-benzoquinol methylase